MKILPNTTHKLKTIFAQCFWYVMINFAKKISKFPYKYDTKFMLVALQRLLKMTI